MYLLEIFKMIMDIFITIVSMDRNTTSKITSHGQHHGHNVHDVTLSI
jgi:hypothetical protein